MKVLVVDDEDMILSLATKILTRQGYEVVTAYSGDEGLKLYAQQTDQIDLLLLDLTMPGISGLETLRRARKITPGLPCIISSGQLTDQDHIPDELMGGLHFLQKPYRADQLSSLVKEILSKESAHKPQ
ncbi:MAG: response regulator [candidate division Zixibacteria bacterium]|nr:response regulator [candidate division Zixibacteria bacterium]MDH3937245.1 response regulator [candidate division Zixibacteria bacterium]MDH4035667.1 response regulator [candidate division Zixibacteria bacterium]